MALVIYNNIYSVVAQNKLSIANASLQKSIERLSSGLRINHAADDASGLAISEKLRSQIRGMAKASMNAQDAISFLQTAEGGLEVIGDILQRMRELAVQAGNGTYTSNDRKELQKEVDQLKSEINRITSSTEFNTKKLLTGQSAALWSSSDPAVSAIVRGAPDEGNYRIEIATEGGMNWVYKTDIFTDGSIQKTAMVHEYEFEVAGTASAVTFANVYGEIENTHTVSVTPNAAAVGASDRIYASYRGVLGTGEYSSLRGDLAATATATTYYVLEALRDGDLAHIDSVSPLRASDFKLYSIDAYTGVKTEISTGTTLLDNSNLVIGAGATNVTLDANCKWAKGDTIVFLHQVGMAGGVGQNQYQVDAQGPVLGINLGNTNEFAVVELNGGKVSVGRGVFTVPLNLTSISTITIRPKLAEMSLLTLNKRATTANVNTARVVGGFYPNGISVDILNNATATAAHIISERYLQNIAVSVTAGGSVTNRTGSFVIEVLNDISKFSTATTSDFKVTFIDALTGLETEYSLPTVAGTATNITVTFAGTNIIFTQNTVGTLARGDKILTHNQGAIASATNIAVVGDFKVPITGAGYDNFTVHNTQMNSTGQILRSQVQISLRDTASGVIQFQTVRQIATLDTKLRDIPLFTNADGRMVLDNAQELTLFGNGRSASIYLEGNDTIEELQTKLSKALVELGMGTGNSMIDNNLVHYVTEEEAQESGFYAVAGTFVFQGALTGNNSRITLIGDQDILNAMSVMSIQDGDGGETKVTIRDAHTGKLIGTDTVSDGLVRGIIKGIDVKINNAALNAVLNTTTGKMAFTTASNGKPIDLHIVDNRTSVQIGANQGQMFDISIAQMSTSALGIDDAFVTTMFESQRAITKFSQALERVTSARATIGAQINRLEYTVRNLSVSKENLIASESRIRDLDIAEESATLARNQILLNSAIAMLAQANTMPQVALQLIGGR